MDSQALHQLAYEASRAFIEYKKPLNDTIGKLAQRHSLSSEQVTRVCELANKLTFKDIFNKQKVADFHFPLAKSQEVLGSLDKVVIDNSDYSSVPVQRVFLKESALGTSDDTDKAALNRSLQRTYHRFKAAGERYGQEKLAIAIELKTEIEKLADTTRQMVLKGTSFPEVFKFAISARPKWNGWLTDVFSKLGELLASKGDFGSLAREATAEDFKEKLREIEPSKRMVKGSFDSSNTHPLVRAIDGMKVRREKLSAMEADETVAEQIASTLKEKITNG